MVARNGITGGQLSRPWKWLDVSDGVRVGGVIDSDGDATGQRGKMMDMAIEDVA